jgi:hypothetical protein
MSGLSSLKGAPKLPGTVIDSRIRLSDKHTYMKNSIWKRKLSGEKKYPEVIIIIQDTFFISDKFPNLIHYKIYENKEPSEEKFSIIPSEFQENYEFSHKLKEKESSVVSLPPIKGGARSTGKTIQYLGKSHTVYIGSKGGKFIYTDASHKNKKYVK